MPPPIAQVLGVVGVTGSAAAMLMVRLMEGQYAGITDGSFVMQYTEGHGLRDRWGPHIVDNGRFSRGWGMRTTSEGVQRPHGGIDLCGPQGTVVRAMRTGLVEHSDQGNGYGECILLRHVDGTTSFYAHLNERAVTQGMLVMGGSPIGTMGRTSGTGSIPSERFQMGGPMDRRCRHFANMGIHLHFSTHGYGQERLPHQRRMRQTVSTDKEWQYGSDPVQILGAHGTRQVAQQAIACSPWSRDWATA
jgi:hypothetical protein